MDASGVYGVRIANGCLFYGLLSVWLCACAADPPALEGASSPEDEAPNEPNPTLDTTPQKPLSLPDPAPQTPEPAALQRPATAQAALDLLSVSGAAALLQIPQGDAQAGFDLFATWSLYAADPWPREWSVEGVLSAHPPLTWINQWPDAGRSPESPLLVSLLEPSPASLQRLLAGGGSGLTRVWVQASDPDAHRAALLAFLSHQGLTHHQDFVCADGCALLSSPDGSLHVLVQNPPHAGRVEVLALRAGCAPAAGVQILWDWLAAEHLPKAPQNLPERALVAWAQSANPSLLWLPERLMRWADAEQQHSAQRAVLEAPLSDLNDAWLDAEFLRWKRRQWMQSAPQKPLSASALLREPDGIIRVLSDSPSSQPINPPKPWPLVDIQTPDSPFLEWIWQPAFQNSTLPPIPKDLDDWPELGQIIRHPGLLSLWHVLPLLRTPHEALQRLASMALGLNGEQLKHLRGVHLALHGWPSERAGSSIRGALAVVFDAPLVAHNWAHQAHRWAQRRELALGFAFLPNPLGVAVVVSQHSDPAQMFALGRSDIPPAHVYLAWTPLSDSPQAPDTPPDAPTRLVLTACADAWGWNAALHAGPVECLLFVEPAPGGAPSQGAVWDMSSVWAFWEMFAANFAAARFDWSRAAQGYGPACEANITGACALFARAFTRAQGLGVEDLAGLPAYVYSERVFGDSLFLALHPDGAWADGVRLPCEGAPTPEALLALRALLSGDAAWHPRPVVLALSAGASWEQVAPWLEALSQMGLQDDLWALADASGEPVVVKVALAASASWPLLGWSPVQTPPLPICEQVLAASVFEVPAAGLAEVDLQPLILSAAPQPVSQEGVWCALAIVRYPDRFVVAVDGQPAEEFGGIEALYAWVEAGAWSGCEATLWISTGVSWGQALEAVALLRHRRVDGWEPSLTPLSTFKEKDKGFKESVGGILYPLDLLPLLRLSAGVAR